jgi:hypothetical protein
MSTVARFSGDVFRAVAERVAGCLLTWCRWVVSLGKVLLVIATAGARLAKRAQA